jgi:hypothetical protein
MEATEASAPAGRLMETAVGVEPEGIAVLDRRHLGPQSVRSSVVRAHTSPTESTG